MSNKNLPLIIFLTFGLVVGVVLFWNFRDEDTAPPQNSSSNEINTQSETVPPQEQTSETDQTDQSIDTNNDPASGGETNSEEETEQIPINNDEGSQKFDATP